MASIGSRKGSRDSPRDQSDAILTFEVDEEESATRQALQVWHWSQYTNVILLIGLGFLTLLLLSLVLFYGLPETKVHSWKFKRFNSTLRYSSYDPRKYYPCENVHWADSSCDQNRTIEEKPERDIDKTKALSYVSKSDPPPGFEKWLNFAQENKCHLGAYTRIEKDMEAFRDSGTGRRRILRSHVDAAKQLPNTAVFLVKDGKLERSGDDDEGLKLQDKIQRLISRFVLDLPDMEFVVNINDQPRVLPGNSPDASERMNGPLCQNASESFQKFRHLHGYVNNRQTGAKYEATSELIALFSQAKINDCHRDILHPSVYTIENRMFFGEDKKLPPWKSRKETLFFRGSTTGGNFTNASTYEISHRQRLVEVAKDNPAMDIKFTDIIQCTQEVCDAMEEQYGHVDRVPEMVNFEHKYVASPDGNSFAARLSKILMSGSLVFRAGMFDEWYEEWLEDGVNYVRVALDYSDLEEKLQWAKDNDGEARRMALRARYFATNHLRIQDMECYWYRLLLEYAAILEL